MKKIVSILLALTMIFSLVACGQTTDAPDESPAEVPENNTEQEDKDSEQPASVSDSDTFEGKIAIVTNTLSQNEEEYRSAQEMVERYGKDKVIHVLWPDNFMTEQEQMISIVTKVGSDPEVKALIINQAVPGTNAAIDKLKETRDDMFIVLCSPQENPPDAVARANLVMQFDELGMGYTLPEQAKALGAKTFVHYSFPRHMSIVMLSARRDIIKTECDKIGLEYVDATAPDPTGDAGVPGAQQFILEDVPKMVEKYGKDTAFFATNCAMQTPLIKACYDAGAIYPQPCCPSPYHGYPAALGIESVGYTVDAMANVVSETAKKLQEGGVLGRFSTWPVPVAMMNTISGSEYAIKWIKGEVGDELDVPVLEQLMTDYEALKLQQQHMRKIQQNILHSD